MRSFKIFLGGFNSTGKTALLNALVSVHSRVTVCHGSKEFMSWLGLKQDDYESLEHLPEDYKDRELSKMIQCLISEVDKNSNCDIWIFAGHFGRIKESEAILAVGDWMLNFNLITLLTADPQILIKRTMNDFFSGTRKRDRLMELINSSSNQLEVFARLVKQTEQISEQLSSRYGIPLLKLNSSEFNPSQLATQLLYHVRLSN